MIRVERLSKRFMIYKRPIHRLADWFAPGRPRFGREFWALSGIDLDVPEGGSLGIVGVNGAGKSTLLKIIMNTMAPTEGSVKIAGRVSGLLELGTGFHPDFTGRQNIEFNGKAIGLSDEELAGRMDSILSFAELGEFIDQPLRTYSSGMILRLGFSVATAVEPDVLIVDEALSVGDVRFQHKCLNRLAEFRKRGATVLFVSHDPSLIKKFCDEAVLLDGGKIADQGKPDQVLDYYQALLAEQYRDGGKTVTITRPKARRDIEDAAASNAAPETGAERVLLTDTGHRTGNWRAVITSVFLDSPGHGGNRNIFVTGAHAALTVRWVALKDVPEATIGISLKDRLGQDIYGVNTAYRDTELPPLKAGEAMETVFEMKMNLGEGHYWVTVAIHTGEAHTQVCYDWVEQAISFQVLPDPQDRFEGLCRLSPVIEAHTTPAVPAELDYARRQAGEV